MLILAVALLALCGGAASLADPHVVVTATAKPDSHNTATITGQIQDPGAAGSSYAIELVDPKGHAHLQNGTLGPSGASSFTLQVGRVAAGPGLYTLKVTVGKGSTVQTGSTRVEVIFLGAEEWIVVDGPGAGLILVSDNGVSGPLSVGPDEEPNRTLHADGSIAPPSPTCGKRHYVGRLYADREAKQNGCGWGHAVPAGEVTELFRRVADLVTEEHSIVELLREKPPMAKAAFHVVEIEASVINGLLSKLESRLVAGEIGPKLAGDLERDLTDVKAHVRKAFDDLRPVHGVHPSEAALDAAAAASRAGLTKKTEVMNRLRRAGLVLKETAPKPPPPGGSEPEHAFVTWADGRQHNRICVYLSGPGGQQGEVSLVGSTQLATSSIISPNPVSFTLDAAGHGLASFLADDPADYQATVQRHSSARVYKVTVPPGGPGDHGPAPDHRRFGNLPCTAP